jgi:cobalamin-dependent methionine synthase I
MENIYVDPLVQPMSVNNSFGVEFVGTIEKIVTNFAGIHTACGLSNISYGLPARKFMNQTFMVMAIAKGLDGAIMNPLDKKILHATSMTILEEVGIRVRHEAILKILKNNHVRVEDDVAYFTREQIMSQSE